MLIMAQIRNSNILIYECLDRSKIVKECIIYIVDIIDKYFNLLNFCRVQQESSDSAERNRFLVSYVDYAFDDFGGRQATVYPGLSTVWGSLARSKVKVICFIDSLSHCRSLVCCHYA